MDSIVLELRGELLIQEGRLLRVTEGEALHLLFAREGVEAPHEVIVSVGGAAKGDRAVNDAITICRIGQGWTSVVSQK